MNPESLNLRAREAFYYDASLGLRWRKASKGHAAGARVGKLNAKGACVVWWNGKLWTVAQLTWFYHNGELPPCNLYHANGDHSDNRIENITTEKPFQPRKTCTPSS